jgi:hypothetical protein
MVPELGVIEGYFGRPWRHEDRRKVMARQAELGFAFFHYAPKPTPSYGVAGASRTQMPRSPS